MKYLPLLIALTLPACTLQSAVALHCKGECSLDVDRGIDIKAPEPK